MDIVSWMSAPKGVDRKGRHPFFYVYDRLLLLLWSRSGRIMAADRVQYGNENNYLNPIILTSKANGGGSRNYKRDAHILMLFFEIF